MNKSGGVLKVIGYSFAAAFAAFLFFGLSAAAATATPRSVDVTGYDKAIEKHVRFLKKQKQTPVDYILGLFERNDLVVLCERFHAEVTQYDMIYEVVSDPRFRKHAGNIFTETGAATLRPYVDSFLMDDQLTDAQVNERLRYIARHMGREVAWEKTNFYDFLRKLYYLTALCQQISECTSILPIWVSNGRTPPKRAGPNSRAMS